MSRPMDVDRRRSRSRSPVRENSQERRRGRSRSPQRSRDDRSRSGSSTSSRQSRSPSRGRKSEPQVPKVILVPDPYKIELTFVPKIVEEEHIKEIFGTYGDIINVDNMDTRFGRGTGGESGRIWYVNYMSEQSAKKAIVHMHGGRIAGKEISVDLASQKTYPDRLPSEEREKVLREYERRNGDLVEHENFAPKSSYRPGPSWKTAGDYASDRRRDVHTRRGRRNMVVDEPPPTRSRYRGDYR